MPIPVLGGPECKSSTPTASLKEAKPGTGSPQCGNVAHLADRRCIFGQLETVFTDLARQVGFYNGSTTNNEPETCHDGLSRKCRRVIRTYFVGLYMSNVFAPDEKATTRTHCAALLDMR